MRADKAPLHWEFAHVIYALGCMRADQAPLHWEVGHVIFVVWCMRADIYIELVIIVNMTVAKDAGVCRYYNHARGDGYTSMPAWA